jgi:C4-dicarboxylate transporter DctM subunit
MLVTLGLTFCGAILLGAPVAFALGMSALAAFIDGGLPFQIIVQRMYMAIDQFPLLAVPMFILAGELMARTGLVRGLLRFCDSIVGGITGGVGHVTVLAGMFFGGMTGAAVAETSALGPLEIPMMDEAGYDHDYSVALVAAASTMGPIIPPSIPMVIYGIVCSVSIGALFLGGIIPGILIAGGLMAHVYVVSVLRNYPRRTVRLTFREFIGGLRAGLLAMGIPVVVVGGILGGIVTPTEASAIAVAYALAVGILQRTLSLKGFYDSILETGSTTAVVFMVLAGAGAVSYLITTQQVAAKLGLYLTSHQMSAGYYLLLVNIVLLIVGCFLDTGAAIIIFAPILAPVAMALGIDPVHFGLVVVLNLVIGLLTPPVGAVLYVACGVGKINLERLVRALWPLLLIEIGVLFLITYVPFLVTAIPSMFFVK